jgi:membrane protein YqaA with SNARE-associated domain
MIKEIYTKIIELSKTKYGIPVLCLVAFLESFIFPIPPDIFLIFLVLAYKNKAFYLAFLCTLLSVTGGILGYLIGSFFFDSLGQGILNYFNLNEKFLEFSESYSDNGFFIVMMGGFTFVPYKIITLSSGFVKMDFIQFILASTLSRGARFFLVATLLYFFGKKIEKLLIKRFGLICTILFLIILIIYFIMKYFGFI